MNRQHLLCGAALLLAGCSEMPLPTLSAGDVPAAFSQDTSAAAPIWPAADWWRGYGDAQLSALIEQVHAANLDMAQAEARLRQADARARQAGAALLPTVNLNAGNNTFFGSSNGNSVRETDYSVGLGASYELDFWGKNRSLADSAEAARAASQADRATVALTVTGSVAATYFQILSLRSRITVAEANLQSSQDILKVVQRRVDAGYSPAADLLQERANIAAQLSTLPSLRQQELEARGTLAVLLGRPPEGFAVIGDTLDGITAPAVAPGLPAELLARRPDIATAEANLIAAHADLAAARAAFLPAITLNATGGLQYPAIAAAINTLPGLGLGANLGAALVQTIFDGGRIAAKTDEARAHEEELLAAYRAVAINAFSDVENALGSLKNLSAQENALQDQVAQAEKVLGAARRKYDAGSADFLVITDAERSLYTARDQLSDVRRARLTASVMLYKALGGGFVQSEAGQFAAP